METTSFETVRVNDGLYTGWWRGWKVRIDTTDGEKTFGVVHGNAGEVRVLVTVRGGRAHVKYDSTI